MKKTLLTLSAACLMTASAFAQISQTQCSGNIVTEGEDGYAFNFNSSAANNCFANGGVAFIAADEIENQSWAINNDGVLTVTVPTMTDYDDARQTMRFYKDGCGAQIVDLSAPVNRKLSLKVTSSATTNRQLLVIFNSGEESNYAASGLNVLTIVPGENTFTDLAVDLTGITDASTISTLGLFFRGATGWGDVDAAGTYKIDYIYVGTATASTAPTPPTDCGTVTANNNANVVNDQVSVFPNPAKGAFTVDMTAMNNAESAFVKVLNANGNIVKEFTTNNATPSVITEGLVKGIYLVQVTSGNKIATKKVVVE
ncbi:MAG: Secretion system C-terminal sorting domain [Cytophagaceae bacterium]|jgi:hypothetical protein|nr:Secretion system C-terminal sorting domain [Cytophagaceae bacterium]